MYRLLCGLALLFVLGCRAPLGSPAVQPRIYNIDDTHDPGKTASAQVQGMEQLIAPYKAQLDDQMNRVLAEVGRPLTKGSPESPLGNWTADLTYNAARTAFPDRTIAFAALNPGGLRVQEIGKGPLLVSEVYELMPFDNELVLVDLSGAEVKAFVNHMANKGGWPVSSALSVDRRDGKLTALLNGEAFDPAARYLIAVPDYVANGGSDSAMLVGKPQVKSGQRLRDLWIAGAERTGGTIDVRTDGKRFRLD